MVTVRPYRDGDAPHLSEIYFESVRQIARRDYTAAQVEAWAPAPPDARNIDLRARDGRILLVALDDAAHPIAYGDLERDGHVDHLYCHPTWVGKGVASCLYEQLERIAREQQLIRLFVEASETARPFFEKRGFISRERNVTQVRGVWLHNYTMEKVISEDDL